jgi:HlyD family secretion protein
MRRKIMQATTAAKEGKRKRWIVVGSVTLFLVAGLLLVPGVLGRLRDSRAAGQTHLNDVVTAFRGDLSANVTASGQVEPDRLTVLSVDTPELVASVHVRVGDEVQAGDGLVQLKTDDLALQVERAEQSLALSEADLEALLSEPRAEDVAAAEAAVLSAQVNLDNLLAGPSEQDVTESEANVRAQEANVASAAAAYRSTLESISASAVATAQADLVDAQIAYDEAKEASEDDPNGDTHEAFVEAAENLAIAQAALDELLAGPNQGTVGSAAAGVSAATANVDEAEADYELLLSGASESEIAAAKANLAQAQADLASLTAGASAEEIAVAEAEVEQARLALADAQEALAKATVTAPFDGLVTAVDVAEGEYATGAVVELVSSALNVVLNVDEVDVGALAVGQPAVIMLEAWPDVEIRAQIASIAPSANVSGDGIVSFDVKLSLEETDLPVLVGMTADARLVTAEHANVLLVPNAAITADREAGTYTANLLTGEVDGVPVLEPVQVTIGLRDDDFTEITSGLTEGDRVAIGALEAPTQRFGPFGGS